MSPSLIILYVADPMASAAFYTALLGRPPIEQSPGFVMFALESGLKLGLWRRSAVLPAAPATPGAGELVLMAESPEAVDATHEAWSAQGLAILAAPATAEFGHSFVAADPDGHRLRVLAPS